VNFTRRLIILTVVAVFATTGAIIASSKMKNDDTFGMAARTSSLYSYAILFDAGPGTGIEVSIRLGSVNVASGHTAAWVGASTVGGWVQAGIASFSNGSNTLYVETGRKGYREVKSGIRPGDIHRFTLIHNIDGWTVSVDGVKRAGPIKLGIAVAVLIVVENYKGLNLLSYKFRHIRVLRLNGWQSVPSATYELQKN
jgi:hypothetical protein